MLPTVLSLVFCLHFFRDSTLSVAKGHCRPLCCAVLSDVRMLPAAFRSTLNAVSVKLRGIIEAEEDWLKLREGPEQRPLPVHIFRLGGTCLSCLISLSPPNPCLPLHLSG